jgi:hypothetical protein
LKDETGEDIEIDDHDMVESTVPTKEKEGVTRRLSKYRTFESGEV